MTFGPFLFAQPLALLGLLALPVIWWLLRATPPEPKHADLPSLQLLEGLEPREETPDKTPWWILLLRCAAAALAILGFAKPSFAPAASETAPAGPTLIIVDDGWTSAARWRDVARAARAAADEAGEDGAAVHLLFTAPRDLAGDPGVALNAAGARSRLQSASPAPWPPDRLQALDALDASDLAPARIIWISDGFDHGAGDIAARRIADIAPTEIRVAAPRGAFALTSAVRTPDGAEARLLRRDVDGRIEAVVIAETDEGASAATATARFEDGAAEAAARFVVPSAQLNQVARFRILGAPSAGAAWLWDDSAKRPRVGLADPEPSAQPLLGEYYYVRRALEPHAELIADTLAALIEAQPDAIILGDRGEIDGAVAEDLAQWIDAGGALIRFAGPKLAAQRADFTPVALRPATRALGGALAWDEPQAIAAPPPTSPFAGVDAPDDAFVRRQVLAEPGPDLAAKTWVRLEDGTPLVTAERRGRGAVVLFHVTADPDWSDLPFTGAFVDMLRRAASAGGGAPAAATDPDGSFAPERTLDGFGALEPPPDTAKPIAGDAFATATADVETPPGLYASPAGVRALNVGRTAPAPMAAWPANAKVIEDASSQLRRGLDGWLLTAALTLVLIDLMVALGVAGRLPRLRARAAAGVLGGVFAFGVAAPSADAQSNADAAALELRFAYVETNDRRTNDVIRAGLEGLSLELFLRTAVEPGEPHPVRLGQDPLELYPLIYYAPPRDAPPLDDLETAAINAYLRGGGALVVDTRDAAPGRRIDGVLSELLAGVDAPPLEPAPQSHVIARSFYLLSAFPGRIAGGQLWLEAGSADVEERRGDGVSSLFIGDADWAGAWAVDQNRRPLLPMETRERDREMAIRFGVNLVMYVLTGNYKEDQVHVPDLLDRLGEEAEFNRNRPGAVRRFLTPDGDPTPRGRERDGDD